MKKKEVFTRLNTPVFGGLIVFVLAVLVFAVFILIVIRLREKKTTSSSSVETVVEKIIYQKNVQITKWLICNLSVRGFSDWVFIENAEEIPYQKGDLKSPMDLSSQIKPPSIKKRGSVYLATLFTWTEKGGLVAKWTVTIEGKEPTFIRGEVIQVAVGHHIALPTEGSFLPTPSALLVNEKVASLNIGNDSSCQQYSLR